MKVLIFSDSHTHHSWLNRIIDLENPDLTIHLGDYFDDFGDSPDDNIKSAHWLLDKINQPNFIGLIGNHDLPYFFKATPHTWVTGFTLEKYRALMYYLDYEVYKKLHWWCWLDDDLLLTHAGLNNHWIRKFNVPKTQEGIEAFLKNGLVEANRALANDGSHWFYEAGMSRAGASIVGGLVWNDWDYEFAPIKGISQICGHTPDFKTRIIKFKNQGGSVNYCIDTFLGEYMIYDSLTKKVKIKQNPEGNYHKRKKEKK